MRSIGTKFAVQDVCYGINDTIRINANAFSDLIDQRIAINQPSREQPDSGIFFSKLMTAIWMSLKPLSSKDSLIGSI